jgi:hypothetical protein
VSRSSMMLLPLLVMSSRYNWSSGWYTYLARNATPPRQIAPRPTAAQRSLATTLPAVVCFYVGMLLGARANELGEGRHQPLQQRVEGCEAMPTVALTAPSHPPQSGCATSPQTGVQEELRVCTRKNTVMQRAGTTASAF